MKCNKCNKKFGILWNYGTDDRPLCFDCELDERAEKQDALKKDEVQLLIDKKLDTKKLSNIKDDGIKNVDLEVEDDFEDYSDKNVLCSICKVNLPDSDENYGSKESPLCKKCKGLARVIENGKSVKGVSWLTIAMVLGISSISVFVFSEQIWPGCLFSTGWLCLWNTYGDCWCNNIINATIFTRYKKDKSDYCNINPS